MSDNEVIIDIPYAPDWAAVGSNKRTGGHWAVAYRAKRQERDRLTALLVAEGYPSRQASAVLLHGEVKAELTCFTAREIDEQNVLEGYKTFIDLLQPFKVWAVNRTVRRTSRFSGVHLAQVTKQHQSGHAAIIEDDRFLRWAAPVAIIHPAEPRTVLRLWKEVQE